MAYDESNGHGTDDVKVVTPIRLGPSIPITAGDAI